MRAVLYDNQCGGVRANVFYARPFRFRETDGDTQKDERGVCEKLIRFESFLIPSLSIPSL